MSYYDMALDAGYRGDEARQYAEYIEQGEREEYERREEERLQIAEQENLLHALADASDDQLIGELVKRGVLHKSRRMMPATPTERWVPFERFATGWEPVGSVEGEG